MRPHGTRFLTLTALAATAALALAACSSNNSSGGNGGGSASKAPITIGVSLSLTGDFSADGQAFKRGYELWAAHVNSTGGLLGGRKVTLDILNDGSNTSTVAANYTKLIASNHVDLVFGPFSTLLTVPSAEVAARHGYAMIEGAGSGPAVYQLKLNNVFAVSPPVANQLVQFANWVKSLPANQRPKTAAYPMGNDPFTVPMVQTAQHILQSAGVKTVYNKIFPEETPDYKPVADQVAASKAQMVVLGSIDVPSVDAFMTAFEQQHYNPSIMAAAAGPDQGAAFLSAVGAKNATGIMVPNGWYGGEQNPISQAMVQAYIAKYGGTASDINADVAEAYSVGLTAQAAITATKGVSNSAIIRYLHSGVTVQTAEGPAKFNSIGVNTAASVFMFQWQTGSKFVQVLPTGAPGSVPIVNPKPAWGKG